MSGGILSRGMLPGDIVLIPLGPTTKALPNPPDHVIGIKLVVGSRVAN